MIISRRRLLQATGILAITPNFVFAQQAEIPEHNRASLTEAPPRPPLGDGEARARALFDAIVHDDPARAEDFFLPREPFRLIKRMSAPDPLWDRIHRAYLEDIHELHAATPDLERAEFVRLRFTGRRGWVVIGEESNRLPYWAQRHSWLEYRVGAQTRQIEVRTMIAWGDRWYITHLSEFH